MNEKERRMMRVLTFRGEEIDRVRFRFLFAAALNGPLVGDDGQQKRRSWEEQRADGKALRALKGIGEEQTQETPQGEVRFYTLRPEGGKVRLSAEQFDKLKTWWGRMQWPTYDIDLVEDAYEWLCGAATED